jgi:hypothetical protein
VKEIIENKIEYENGLINNSTIKHVCGQSHFSRVYPTPES